MVDVGHYYGVLSRWVCDRCSENASYCSVLKIAFRSSRNEIENNRQAVPPLCFARHAHGYVQLLLTDMLIDNLADGAVRK